MGCMDWEEDSGAEKRRVLQKRSDKAMKRLERVPLSKFNVRELIELVNFVRPQYQYHTTNEDDVKIIERLSKKARKKKR